MAMIQQFQATPPLSLYIHIPWCIRKCPYCDFNSHEKRDRIPEREYLQALTTDLEQSLPLIWGRSVQSVFIGGGTPSLLSPEFYDQLFSNIRARLSIIPSAEITMEANPGATDTGKLQDFRDIGINRLSIGVQSFDDTTLEKLGRIHTAADAIKTIEAAHYAGFESINTDLMFGLPGQNEDLAHKDIATALALEPQHLSYYQLTLEPNTAFYHNPPRLPYEDDIAAIQHQGWTLLGKKGYEQYEVSAFSKPQQQCQHNLNYWQFGDYLGIGAGAHGKLTQGAEQCIYRTTKPRSPKSYIATQSYLESYSKVTPAELPLEFAMNAFRLTKGFAPQLFTERTGLAINTIEQELREAEKRDLIEWTIKLIQPTKLGKTYLNDLLALFLNE
ncbi:Radical SAM family enzyme, similar to coproporphyrinogen III oxidase, oxygen-independent, clustered with nucleoside-triphosphatase RdgB [hydrothermal vent metagenome]|uniref:Radical SAM family enzyme, similar to coproporphyrinogen III oxidase, oxygen-independent, clustered with nucleoside-triphosphatase RdgB n=1 Tax=hydrothermal vent metagenome TaxID=652676 RepID=A0A3B0YVW5_9ZZZZ